MYRVIGKLGGSIAALAFLSVLTFSCSKSDSAAPASGIEYGFEIIDGEIDENGKLVSRPSVSLTVLNGASDFYEIAYSVDDGKETVLKDIPMGITVFFKCDETEGGHSVFGTITGEEGSQSFSCQYKVEHQKKEEEKGI